MAALVGRLGEFLARGPNRIALSTALRGTLSTVVPLALLPSAQLGRFAYPAVLGALATSLVDVGGPYRTRLIAMLVQALGGPCLLLLGGVSVSHGFAAAAVMAIVASAAGLMRAVGTGGTSLSVNMPIAFLVGLQIGQVHVDPGAAAYEAQWALGYSAGGLWTICVALAFWQLRPYRRLEQEVAGAWEAVAALLREAVGSSEDTVVGRRRHEQRMNAALAAARAAIERSREVLGDLRTGVAGVGTTIAHLLVLLDSAAGVAASAVTLAEMFLPARGQVRSIAADELTEACQAVARKLLDGKGELPLAALNRRLAELSPAPSDAEALTAASLVLKEALSRLEEADEALRMLFGARRRLPDLLRLPLAHRLPRGLVLDALRAHLTRRSAVFRHAIRIGIVTACDTLLLVRFRLPHGIWLPLTSLVILQPDYGGTVTRALHRSAGTIAGAAIAGVLLATVHGSFAYNATMAALLFAMFLLIRRNYGYGITFLTPLIILLIGMASTDPWADLGERVAYTIVGAALALAAGYLLWPRWERDQLRDRLARAIHANRDFVMALLEQLAHGSTGIPDVVKLRQQAEIAVANADAGFQRMLAEPKHRSGPRGGLLPVGFALLVYLHRLCRHGIALAGLTQGAEPHASDLPPAVALPRAPLARLAELAQAVLGDIERVVSEGRAPVPWPGISSRLAELIAELTPSEGSPGALVAVLVGRIANDLTGMLGAAGYSRASASRA
jgi:uncharacterized membrane protein YccC